MEEELPPGWPCKFLDGKWKRSCCLVGCAEALDGGSRVDGQGHVA